MSDLSFLVKISKHETPPWWGLYVSARLVAVDDRRHNTTKFIVRLLYRIAKGSMTFSEYRVRIDRIAAIAFRYRKYNVRFSLAEHLWDSFLNILADEQCVEAIDRVWKELFRYPKTPEPKTSYDALHLLFNSYDEPEFWKNKLHDRPWSEWDW